MPQSYSEDIDDLYVTEKPLSTGAMAKYHWSLKLEHKFSAMTRFDEPYTMFSNFEKGDDHFIYVPRGVCPIGEKDLRTDGFKCGFQHRITPRDAEQERCMDETDALIRAGESFQVRMGTGRGKTVLGLRAIANYNRSAAVVVPKEDLVEQWIERIQQHLKIPRHRIGMVQGDICDYQAKWITICMLHSVAKYDRYPKDMYKQFGLVMFDECHRLGAETFSQSCEVFPARVRVGLSATPERQDGKELLIEAHIGPVRVISDATPMKFKVLVYRSSWECPRHMVRLENGSTVMRRIEHSAGKCGHIINMIVKHHPTNMYIANFAKKAFDKGRQGIFFSDRIDHLEHLIDLAAHAGVPRSELGLYVGGMSKSARNKAAAQRMTFTTFGSMKEGTDLPWKDTMGLCTPRSDIKQAVGRILREYDDKLPPVVLDVVHEDSPVFHGYSKKRRFFYDEEKAVVKNVH